MADLSLQQKKIIEQFREAYKGTEYAKLSDVEILTIMNEGLSNVKLSEDERISAFGLDGKSANVDGVQLNQPLTKEEKQQLKQKISTRVKNVSTDVSKAEKGNTWIGKAWSWTKNTFGFGASSNKVREQQKK
jgi:GTP:adenosylcobinamide-phosphate guanylyltransferase